jgi:hypothetical protein
VEPGVNQDARGITRKLIGDFTMIAAHKAHKCTDVMHLVDAGNLRNMRNIRAQYQGLASSLAVALRCDRRPSSSPDVRL